MNADTIPQRCIDCSFPEACLSCILALWTDRRATDHAVVVCLPEDDTLLHMEPDSGLETERLQRMLMLPGSGTVAGSPACNGFWLRRSAAFTGAA